MSLIKIMLAHNHSLILSLYRVLLGRMVMLASQVLLDLL